MSVRMYKEYEQRTMGTKKIEMQKAKDDIELHPYMKDAAVVRAFWYRLRCFSAISTLSCIAKSPIVIVAGRGAE